MNPFRNILRLSVGDFLAKTLFFLAFIYLARILGVTTYGVLEFSLSALTYFLLMSDGGLELWAIREAARGKDIKQLISQVTPLRLGLALLAYGLLLATLPLFPDYPNFRLLLLLFGLTLFAQAVNLKWVFMGREQMSRVAVGLIVAQIIFALAVFGLIRQPEHIVWVPLLRLLGDVSMAAYFWQLTVKQTGPISLRFSLSEARQIIRPAVTMGASHALAYISYNFDTVLLGFMIGPTVVGLYNAAYKPITAMLAIPVTYFLGLFPVLSRTYAEGEGPFQAIVTRSLRLMSILAIPIGVGGTLLAGQIISFLFGPAYASSVLPLQILSWSATLVMIRGTYRQALNAAGRTELDLRCATIATTLNLSLNIALIPYYDIVGASTATLASEALWFSLVAIYFDRDVARLNPLRLLSQPLLAGLVMGFYLWGTPNIPWPLRGASGGLLYFAVLLLLGEPEVRHWFGWGKQLLERYISGRKADPISFDS